MTTLPVGVHERVLTEHEPRVIAVVETVRWYLIHMMHLVLVLITIISGGRHMVEHSEFHSTVLVTKVETSNVEIE